MARSCYGFPGFPSCVNCSFDVERSKRMIEGPSDVLYQHYLDKNIYPSSQEAVLMKAELEEALVQRLAITDTIARFQSYIARLEEEKDRIDGVALKIKSILRPVHQLPPELLCRIFHFCTDIPETSDPIGYPLSSLKPQDAPWSLAQVCRSWRKLAIQTPSLWTLVSIRGVESSEGPSFARLDSENHRLRLQLRRSCPLPLTIFARASDVGKFIPMDHSLALLCSHTEQWKSLRIDLHRDNVRDLANIKGLLPSLQSLEIHFHETGISGALDLFELAPQLRKLSISGNGCVIDEGGLQALCPIKLPFSQITEYLWYDDGAYNAGHCLFLHHAILLRLCNLKKCRLFVSTDVILAYEIFSSSPLLNGHAFTLALQQLTELELHRMEPEARVEEIFPWISAPSLERLTVSSSGPDQTHLSDFIINHDNLTSLTIHDINMPPPDFEVVLSRLSSLRDLSFGVAGGIEDCFLTMFISTEPGTNEFSLVPELQNLSLLRIPDNLMSIYDDDVLLDMLEARRRSLHAHESAESQRFESRLLFVQLDKHLTGSQALDRLETLENAGLRVNFKTLADT
ncbi:hypothetical protein AAF712_011001 [Marasmius tenuissimus]|uniref:F-box domain-containing protein n=1 Tax=Marasmius tenuissimus TaxID=585030 RepID=A0ABR2ZMF1_9AGAR